MNRKMLFLYVMLSFFMLMNTKQVYADMGPKPSLNLIFTGLEEEEYYVTTLSSKSVMGPWRNGKEYQANPHGTNEKEEIIYAKFQAYEDVNGYFFIGYMSEGSNTHAFHWTYYPPTDFKVLLYFPEYDKFLISADAYQTYAFDSYFKVDIIGMEDIVVSENPPSSDSSQTPINLDSIEEVFNRLSIGISRSYDYKGEIMSMSFRILGTLMIELLIASVFFYKDKKARIIIIFTNIVTQILLNLALYVIYYKQGSFLIVFYYVLLEILIIILEGYLYETWIGKKNEETGKNYRPYIYSFVGNTASFFCGLILSVILPGLF